MKRAKSQQKQKKESQKKAKTVDAVLLDVDNLDLTPQESLNLGGFNIYKEHLSRLKQGGWLDDTLITYAIRFEFDQVGSDITARDK
jgi:hypothetical protein